MDDPKLGFGFSMLEQVADIINSVMNPLCSSNVISLICNSWFRECMSVEDDFNRGGGLWLPSLLCRHQCEKHWDIWNKCVADLESDPKTKHDFEKQMLALVCAVPYTASFLLFSFLGYFSFVSDILTLCAPAPTAALRWITTTPNVPFFLSTCPCAVG